jgi:Rad3-related DNA helicase
MSILDHVPPGYTLRQVQKDTLLEIERNWNNIDVFVLQLSVAAGKSLIAVTVANWRKQRTNILTPQVILQDQYAAEFTDIPVLKGKDRYPCERGYETCTEAELMTNTKCDDCEYNYAIHAARVRPIALCNFHSYINNSRFDSGGRTVLKPRLIIDEAHNLIEILSDTYTINLWQHIHNYPEDMHTKDQVIIWLEKEVTRLKNMNIKRMDVSDVVKHRRTINKYSNIKDGLISNREDYLVSRQEVFYRGKKKPGLKIQPLSLRRITNKALPKQHIEKVILMSATINEKIDIERMGLGNRRVMEIVGDSPIPAENRPLVIDYVGKMGYKDMNNTLPDMIDKIKELAERHKGKGMVHCTYAIANKMQYKLKDKRFMFHTPEDKDEVLQKFKESKDGILIACGLREGISLSGHEYEWQALAKIQFPSLSDPINKHNIQHNKLLYNWQTAITVIQQYGRICRSPTDKGITYVLDKSFKMFYALNSGLFPKYFKDAMR